MNIHIGTAYKVVDPSKFSSLMETIQSHAVAECKLAIQELYTKSLLNPTLRNIIFTDDVDPDEPADVTCSKFYYEKLEAAEKSGDAGPYNISVKLDYWVVDGEFFIRPRALWDMKGVFDFLKDTNGLVDWSYVHGKRPKNVSTKEWAERRNTWSRIEEGINVVGPLTFVVLGSDNYIDIDPTWGGSLARSA